MIVKKPVVFSTVVVLMSFFAIFSSNQYKSPKPKLPSAEFVNPIQAKEEKRASQAFETRKKLLEQALNAYFEDAIKKRLIIGAGVNIVAGDSVMFQGGFGKRNAFKETDTVNAETVFRLGSLSKGFAGVLAGIEVKEGAISWDDKLIEAVPQFDLKNKNHARAITLREVLSHSTGVPYHCYTNLIEDGLPLEEVASRFRIINTYTKPGLVHSYQNAMFALSGTMMEAATGNTIQQLLQNKLFTPLDMKTISTDYEGMVNTGNYAYPHKSTYKGWQRLPVNRKYFNAVPAGGINASADDMGKWMRFLLGHKEEVLDKDGLAEVFEPQIQLPDERKYYQRWKGHLRSSYAYGWRIHEFVNAESGAQSKMIHHGGSVSNFRNEIALFPEEDLGICVLFNSLTPLASQVIPDLHKIVKEIMELPVNEIELDRIASL